MFILGILIFTVGIFFMAVLAMNYDVGMATWVLFDWPTTFFFIVVMIAVIVSISGFKTFVAAINALLSKKYNISTAEKEKAIKLFKLLGKSVVYASVLLTVMGLMQVLCDLSDPVSIGPSIAVALFALFQGAYINLVFIYLAINVLQSRYNAEEKTVISEKQVIDKLLELCYRKGVSPEEVLESNEIFFKKQ